MQGFTELSDRFDLLAGSQRSIAILNVFVNQLLASQLAGGGELGILGNQARGGFELLESLVQVPGLPQLQPFFE